MSFKHLLLQSLSAPVMDTLTFSLSFCLVTCELQSIHKSNAGWYEVSSIYIILLGLFSMLDSQNDLLTNLHCLHQLLPSLGVTTVDRCVTHMAPFLTEALSYPRTMRTPLGLEYTCSLCSCLFAYTTSCFVNVFCFSTMWAETVIPQVSFWGQNINPVSKIQPYATRQH